jgi:thiol:disulfide interchange protein
MQRPIRFATAFAAFAFTGLAFGQEPKPQAPAPATPVAPAAPAAPTTKDDQQKAAKRPVYDEAADTKQQIAAALAKAKRDHQRVLIQWGGNWCPWCILLHQKMTTDPELQKELLYEYQVVHADAGGANDKNVDLAQSYGADLKSFGYPFLTLLDAEGKPLANQETSALELKGADGQSIGGKGAGHDAKKVLALLKANEAPHLEADAVLKAGMDQAAGSGRKLFVHFGAPWCGWCHKLEDWLATDAIAALMAKDYVDVKIDQDRMAGAKQVAAAFSMPEKSGIPWFAIVDPPTGKTLATSTAAKGNIGYPAADDEIAHFMGMLEATRKNLVAADLQAIRASLVEAAKPLKQARQ